MIEGVVVAIVVGTVVFLVGRSVYRTMSGKPDGCGCENTECGVADSCDDSLQKTCGQGSNLTSNTERTQR